MKIEKFNFIEHLWNNARFFFSVLALCLLFFLLKRCHSQRNTEANGSCRDMYLDKITWDAKVYPFRVDLLKTFLYRRLIPMAISRHSERGYRRTRHGNLAGFSWSDNANALNCPGGFPDLCARDSVIATLLASWYSRREINRIRDNLCKFIVTPVFSRRISREISRRNEADDSRHYRVPNSLRFNEHRVPCDVFKSALHSRSLFDEQSRSGAIGKFAFLLGRVFRFHVCHFAFRKLLCYNGVLLVALLADVNITIVWPRHFTLMKTLMQNLNYIYMYTVQRVCIALCFTRYRGYRDLKIHFYYPCLHIEIYLYRRF